MHHSNVEDESCSEMSGKSVLRDTRSGVGSRGKMFGVEAGGNHVPAEGSLESRRKWNEITREIESV